MLTRFPLFHQKDRGFTLIGLLFALAFVVTVITAIGMLTVRTGRAARASREQVIATVLAREGMELVRSLRDDNWFSYPPPYTSGPRPAVLNMKWRGDPGGTPDEQRRALCNGEWVIDVSNARLLDPDTALVPNGELFFSNGVYSHGTSGTLTIFRRRVTITTNGAGNCGEVISATQAAMPNPFSATVTVEWQEKSSDLPRSLSLHGEFYDWVRRR